MRLAFVTFTALVACQSAAAAVAGAATPGQHLANRDIFHSIGDFFSSVFVGEDPTTSTPPATSTRATRTRDRDETTATTDAKTKQTNTHTSSTSKPTNTQSSSTQTGTSTITAPATLSTSTVTGTTSTSVPTNAASSTPSPSPPPPSSSSSGNSSGVSPAGIAVAVILSLAIVALIAWVIFRYHPKSREWWAARQERKYQERSYRDGIDGVAAAGLGRSMTKRQQLASFFTPKTVKLGGGREIRRKSVNWGAPSSATSSTDPSMPPSMSQVPYGHHTDNNPYGSDTGLVSSVSPVCSRVSSISTHMSRSGSTHAPNTTSTSTPGMRGVPSLPPSPINGPVNHGVPSYNYYSNVNANSHNPGFGFNPVQPQTLSPVYLPTPTRTEKPLPAVRINGTDVHELP